MTVEAATFISQLDATKPTATDPKSEGDDHLRLVKAALKAQFPNFGAGAVNVTHTALNYLTAAVSADAAGNVGVGTAAPTGTNSGGYACKATFYANANAAINIKDVNGDWSLGTTAGSLVFYSQTASEERGRFDDSGILIVGTTTALSGGISGLHTNGTAGSGITLGQGGTARGFVFASQATTRVQIESVSGWPIACVAGGTNGVSLASGGTSWGALSDEREKTIIEPITDAAAKVSTLRAVIGRYNSDDEATRRAFLIAQDVNAVLPEAVNEQDERLILQYTDTIPLLVAALKELTIRITALEQA